MLNCLQQNLLGTIENGVTAFWREMSMKCRKDGIYYVFEVVYNNNIEGVRHHWCVLRLFLFCRKDNIKMNNKLKLITTKELAAILGKSESTARELMVSKGFPSVMIRNRYYVREDRLVTWLSGLETQK